MKTIVLTGMMGAGKSTISALLAKLLKLTFIDIDTIIETKEQMSISNIFAQKGEPYFRQLEKETIHEVFKVENQVISLGGGAFENKEIQEFLLKNSTVIYLKTSPEEIFKRIKTNSTRPLLCDNMSIEKIKDILNKREKNYQLAHYTITSDNKTPDGIAKEIAGVLN
jgi:shikimate kinase